MKDFYSILGVPRTASAGEIKQAYRRAAAQHHPDRGGDTARFQEIEEAYRVLGDPDSRKNYDNPNAGININFGGQNFGFDDLFSMFARGGFPGHQHRSTTRMLLWIDIEDSARGGAKTISISTNHGAQLIEINIPPGIDEGDSVQYPGLAPDGHDLIITFRIKPHAIWSRDGNHALIEKMLSIWDLVLGCEFEITDLRAVTVKIKVPAGTQPDTVLRVRGHGFRDKHNGSPGDLLIKIKTQLPGSISDSLLDHIRREHHQ